MLPLADLLHPLPPEAFLKEHWEQQPTLRRQSLDPERARRLIDVSTIEQILSSLTRPGDGWLHLARGGRRGVPSHMLDEAGLIKLQELYGAFAEGDTLYLTKADRLSPALGQACRSLELDLRALGVAFRRSVDVHLFLTPPNGRGFPAHRDDNAVFVVQLDGAKTWRIHDRRTERIPPAIPVRAQIVDPSKLGAATTTYHLQPGDVLYLPEGWVHECAAEGHSLHATFRLFPLRWADALASICERHPVMSSTLPRYCTQDPEQLERRLLALLDTHDFRAALSPWVRQFAHEHAVPARTLPEDGLRQLLLASRLELGTRLTRRASAICDVLVENGEAVLSFPGGSLRGPAALEPVFRFVAAAKELRGCDLPPVAADAAFDPLTLIRRLVRGGLLRIEATATKEV
jgi:ribosomal protein L16 Arg81 hydroxylase